MNNVLGKANLLPAIPEELAKLYGKIAIRLGGLERVVFTALARDEPGDTVENIGKWKGKMLGQLNKEVQNRVNKASKYCCYYANDYESYFEKLKPLTNKRNEIHDAIVSDELGNMFILESSRKKDRNHRLIDIKALKKFLVEVESAITHIDSDSLKAKKGRSMLQTNA